MRFRVQTVAALSLVAGLLASAPAHAQEITVYKSESCGCCAKWIEHLRASGFTPIAKDSALGALARLKAAAGLKPALQSCHTAHVAGYVIEGHVPADDIKRLIAEKRDVVGLAVPGMPIGSPGMEVGDQREPYDVLLVKRDGTTEVFAHR